jgi:ABC-type branched-subunit amino acid transport system substrate-binding protein
VSPLLRGMSLVVVLALASAGCSRSDQSDPADTTTTSTPAPATTTTTTVAPTTTTTTAAVDDGITVDGDTVTADTIYVGLLADLSGPLSGNDVDLVDAQLVFWSDLNESGGIAGRQVELLIEDTGSDIAAHQAAYERLKSGVVFFSHSAGSQTTAAIADDLVSDDRLAVTASSYSGWADPDLGANVIAIGASYCLEAMNGLSAIAVAHQEETGLLPILAIATDDGVYGEDSAAGARVLAEVLELEVRFDGGGTIDPVLDNSAIGAQIASAGVDWTWLATDPAATAEIVAAARSEGYGGAWSGAMPSFSPRLLATELGDYLAENWLHSALLSPMGADTAGMPAVYAALADAYPDRYPSDDLIKGYLEFSAAKQILEHAAELEDLTPRGVLAARADLGRLDFAGIAPATVFADNLNDAATRATALYRPNKVTFDDQGGLSATFATEAASPYDLVEEFFVSDEAAVYSFDGPCYTIVIPVDEG